MPNGYYATNITCQQNDSPAAAIFIDKLPLLSTVKGDRNSANYKLINGM